MKEHDENEIYYKSGVAEIKSRGDWDLWLQDFYLKCGISDTYKRLGGDECFARLMVILKLKPLTAKELAEFKGYQKYPEYRGMKRDRYNEI